MINKLKHSFGLTDGNILGRFENILIKSIHLGLFSRNIFVDFNWNNIESINRSAKKILDAD